MLRPTSCSPPSGEELGLAGTAATPRRIRPARGDRVRDIARSRDPFRKLLAAGPAVTLGLQTFSLIIGGVVRLLLLTGLALPLCLLWRLFVGLHLLLVTLLAGYRTRSGWDERSYPSRALVMLGGCSVCCSR